MNTIMHASLRIVSFAARFGSARSGATTIEYCMLAVMIGIGLIGAASIWGSKATAMYENLATRSVAAQSGQ